MEQAFALLQNTLQQLPACAPLVAPDFTKLALETGQAQTARDLLANLQQASSSIDVVEMLIQLDQQAPQANQTIQRACPVGIPILALRQQISRAVARLFDGYQSGLDPEVVPPLLGYEVEEKNIQEREWQ